MPDPISEPFLFDYFAGKSTALQKQWLSEWLKEPANRILYYQCLDKWESLHPQFRAEVEPALAQFRNAIQRSETRTPAPTGAGPGRRRLGPTWMWAAAVVLLVALGAYLNQDYIRYQTYRTAYGEIRSVRLSDGTQVALNANSTLRVPRWTFGRPRREVHLDGEAEFKVAHRPAHQRFVVRTPSDFAVEVLGTEFVLYARQQRRKVVLSRGKVKVTYQPGRQLMMRPGDWVALEADGALKRRKTAHPARFADWKYHRFTFDKTTLAEISRQIQERFGVTTRITDSTLAQRQVSGIFEAENPDELIEALTDLLQLRFTRTPGGFDIQAPAPDPATSTLTD